jgi:hypothetical protein
LIQFFSLSCVIHKNEIMAKEYHREESKPKTASESGAMYGLYEERYRVVPISEVLKHGMTLEESERRLTEKIHRHFHPEA